MLFLIPFFTLLPDFTIRFFQRIVNPSPADIISSNLLYKENTTFISMSSMKLKKLNLEDSNEISKIICLKIPFIFSSCKKFINPK
jgi:hypothetical protein